MGIAFHVAVYVVLWWLVLFAVLPFGVETQADFGEVVPGSEPAAPVRPRLILKFAVTTAIATLAWLVVFGLLQFGVFDWLGGRSSGIATPL